MIGTTVRSRPGPRACVAQWTGTVNAPADRRRRWQILSRRLTPP